MITNTKKGAEIFDVALCGGGDPNQGYTNTAVQFSAGAVGQVKAAILMGAPTYVYGLSYGVGTCRAGGVSHSHPVHILITHERCTNGSDSLMRGPQPSNAHPPPKFRAIATRPIPIAAMATTRQRTTAMGLNMGPRPLLLSRASSAAAVAALLAAQLPPRGRRRLRQVVGQTVPLCTASAVARGGLARLAALLEPARLPTLTTLSACRWT